VATQPFPGAHFATFPPKLVEPCVLAGSSPAACGECGAPWHRVVASERLLDGKHVVRGSWTDPAQRLTRGRAPLPDGAGHWRCSVRRVTLGWEPGCDHLDDTGRCTVLDPFAGSGTTGVVACRHGRDFLGTELNASYARLARQRLEAAAGARWGEAA
jgi:hypothetical protein